MNKYSNYESKYNGLYSKDNLPRIKDGSHAINFNSKQNKWNTLGFIIHW